MFNVGPMEIVAVLVVALLVFGPKKLPEMGKAIGSAVTEFKKGISGQVDDKKDFKQIDTGNKDDGAGKAG